MKEVKIYTDGSYCTKENSINYGYAGWAFVVIDIEENKLIHEDYGRTPFPAMSRQIDGELHAVKEALLWLKERPRLKASIFVDYLGSKKFYEGEWRPKKKISEAYVNFCNNIRNDVNVIEFIHLHSHTGNYWNDYVDKLAEKGKYLVNDD